MSAVPPVDVKKVTVDCSVCHQRFESTSYKTKNRVCGPECRDRRKKIIKKRKSPGTCSVIPSSGSRGKVYEMTETVKTEKEVDGVKTVITKTVTWDVVG